jgi:hypothetical protein
VNNNLIQVLDYFSKMDVEGLNLVLRDDLTYYDVPKQVFLKRLKEFFNDFEEDLFPSNHLKVYPGACCNKSCDLHLGRTAFRFVTEMGLFFDLRFILEKDNNGVEYVKDIYTCYDLITNEKVEDLHQPIFFWVYEDDKVSVRRRSDHDLLVSRALNAEASWKSYFESDVVNLQKIHSWQIKYASTYLEIGGYIEDLIVHWRWDKFLRIYHDIEKLTCFLADFGDDFDKMVSIRDRPIPEDHLLKLVLNWESRLDNHYTALYGSIFHFTKVDGGFEVSIRLETKIKLVDSIIGKADEFLNWFDKQRDLLMIKYFSFTKSELDEFEERTQSVQDLYKVRKSLNFHIETREKFKKNGVFIPFDLGRHLGIRFFGSF